MILTVMIRDGGNIATGLSPTINGWNTKTRENILSGSMIELLIDSDGSGIYIYDFEDYNENINYAFLIDAGDSISDGNERYILLSAESLLHY